MKPRQPERRSGPRERRSHHARMLALESRLDAWLDQIERHLVNAWAVVRLELEQAKRIGVSAVWRRCAGGASTRLSRNVAGLRAGFDRRARTVARHVGPRLVSLRKAASDRRMIGGAIGVTAAVLTVFIPVEQITRSGGRISSEGAVIPVSHPFGGLVQDIRVREGQEVQAGDLLFRLAPPGLGRDIDVLRRQAARLAFTKARLTALMENSDLELGPEDAALDPARAQAEMAKFRVERSHVRASTARLDQAIIAHRQDMLELEGEIAGLRTQFAPSDVQRATGGRAIGPQGLVQPTTLRVDLASAQARARASRLADDYERARLALSLAETERAELLAERRRAWSAELTDVSADLSEIDLVLARASADSADWEVRAPAGGRIQHLAVAGRGVWAPAGAAMAEILPLDAQLTADLKAPAVMAGTVTIGDSVRLRLGAGEGQPLDGLVKSVSRDVERNTRGEPMRRIVVALLPPADSDAPPVALAPGLPVRAEIVTNRGSVLQSFAEPLFATAPAFARD